MKKKFYSFGIYVILSLLLLVGCVSYEVTWDEVVDYGGIEIGDPYYEQNSIFIPIKCDASGLTKILNEPKIFTSYPQVYFKAASRITKDHLIKIKLYKKVIENGNNISKIKLPRSINKGEYSVMYEDKNGNVVKIKTVVIR